MERIILKRIAKAFAEYAVGASWQDENGWRHWPECPVCGCDGIYHAKDCHIGMAFEDACKIARMPNEPTT